MVEFTQIRFLLDLVCHLLVHFILELSWSFITISILWCLVVFIWMRKSISNLGWTIKILIQRLNWRYMVFCLFSVHWCWFPTDIRTHSCVYHLCMLHVVHLTLESLSLNMWIWHLLLIKLENFYWRWNWWWQYFWQLFTLFKTVLTSVQVLLTTVVRSFVWLGIIMTLFTSFLRIFLFLILWLIFLL